MKIVLENEYDQKVEFHAWQSFDGLRIIRLGCKCCENEDDIILSESETEALRAFLFSKEKND